MGCNSPRVAGLRMWQTGLPVRCVSPHRGHLTCSSILSSGRGLSRWPGASCQTSRAQGHPWGVGHGQCPRKVLKGGRSPGSHISPAREGVGSSDHTGPLNPAHRWLPRSCARHTPRPAAARSTFSFLCLDPWKPCALAGVPSPLRLSLLTCSVGALVVCVSYSIAVWTEGAHVHKQCGVVSSAPGYIWSASVRGGGSVFTPRVARAGLAVITASVLFSHPAWCLAQSSCSLKFYAQETRA